MGFTGITAFKELCKELTRASFALKFVSHVQCATKSEFYHISDVHCEFSVHLSQDNSISYLLEVDQPNSEYLYLVTPIPLSPAVRSTSGCAQQANSSASQQKLTDTRDLGKYHLLIGGTHPICNCH